jgi:ABC-2 type transport system permease protein
MTLAIKQGIGAYVGIVVFSLKEILRYRVNLLFSFLCELVPFYGILCLWRFKLQYGAIEGYGFRDLVTYYVMALAVGSTNTILLNSDVGDNVRTGGLAGFLLMPVSYAGYHAVVRLVTSVCYVIIGMLPLVLMAISLGHAPRIPSNVWVLASFLLAVFLGQVLSFVMGWCLSMMAFWHETSAGAEMVVGVAGAMLAGQFFPLGLLGDGLVTISNCLPFQLLVFVPVEIWLERISPASACASMGIAILWIGGFSVLGARMWRRGLKKYTGMGL